MSDKRELPGGAPVGESPEVGSQKGHRRYDPAFERAVKAGRLTPFEAYSRGTRESYATRLVARFKLTKELALAVADNEMTLMAARKVVPVVPQPPQPPKAAKVAQAPRSARGAIYPLIVVLAVIAAGVFWWRSAEQPLPNPAEVKNVAQGVHIDDFGDVIRVVGDSPQQVLSRFCGAHPEFAAQGLMASNSGAVPVRIGILEKTTAQGELLAIPIREERQSGQWFTGDGRRVVVPAPAPPGASQAAWPSAR